jgi:hypothetical protein
MRADTREFAEREVTGFGEFSDSDRAAACVERDRDQPPVGGDGLVFDAGALFDAALSASRGFGVGFRGGDPVDGEQAEVAQQRLVMNTAQAVS